MASPLLLVTGFPGFLGSRLVRELLAGDGEERVVALVEEDMEGQARKAAAEIAEDRIEVAPGDITEPRLGLQEEQYERLLGEVTSVFHLAAVYDLGVEYEPAHKVNVEGTGNVLELCERAERLERHNYISTAYVAGDRSDVVYEHELALGQGFKNHYESTKFQAELWVRSTMNEIPTTIYRPAIVVGDSRTGETQKFDGPYYLLRTVSLAERRGGPILRVGKGEAPLNVVPVDYVVDAIAAAAREQSAAGETLHLVDPHPATSAEVMEMFSREYAGREPSFSMPTPVVRESLRLRPMRELMSGMPREALPYIDHPVRFDTRRAERVLEPRGLHAPSLREYVAPLVEFFREHEDDPDYAP